MPSRQRGLGGASRVFASIRANTGDVRGLAGGGLAGGGLADILYASNSAESLLLIRLPSAEETAACIVSRACGACGACACLLSLASLAPR